MLVWFPTRISLDSKPTNETTRTDRSLATLIVNCPLSLVVVVFLVPRSVTVASAKPAPEVSTITPETGILAGFCENAGNKNMKVEKASKRRFLLCHKLDFLNASRHRKRLEDFMRQLVVG